MTSETRITKLEAGGAGRMPERCRRLPTVVRRDEDGTVRNPASGKPVDLRDWDGCGEGGPRVFVTRRVGPAPEPGAAA